MLDIHELLSSQEPCFDVQSQGAEKIADMGYIDCLYHLVWKIEEDSLVDLSDDNPCRSRGCC